MQLRDMEGKSYKEIAVVLSLTEEQVQHFLKRFSASEQFVRVGDAVFVLPEHL